MQDRDAVSQSPDRWLSLGILCLVYGLSLADRSVMSIFIGPIKAEYGLSDSGTVFLTATVFAIFYVCASIPFGLLADRANRRNWLVASTVLFSGASVLSGLVHSYPLLLMCRIGVGIGEAGFVPLAISLLADKFDIGRRTTVMSLLTLGGAIGTWAGISGGGALEGAYGWRTALIVFGAAGLVVAVLTLVIREPVRGSVDGLDRAASAEAGFGETLRFCIRRRSVFHTLAGSVVIGFWGWGLSWWIPAFWERSFGIGPAEGGALIGPAQGIVGTVGVLISSALFLWLGRGDLRKPLWFLAALGFVCTIPSIVAVLTGSRPTAVLMLWLFLPMAHISIGPTFALLSSGVLPNMRGQINAIYVALSNVASLALAPQLVGFLSDVLAPRMSHPAESLRYALIPLAFTGFWGVLHFWLATRYIRADLKALTT